MTHEVICADMRQLLPTLRPGCVDAIITDPPYGLSFMGKGWDGQVPGPEYWRECLRVAKPGAHLLAFGGTRTAHRLACAIEDAGWEIRDCLMWLYGSGFPKSHNLSGDWQGWGTALKPAWENILLARKPFAPAQQWQEIDTQLKQLQGALWSRCDAKLAALLSKSNPDACAGELFGSVPWTVADALNTPDVSCVPMDTSPSEWAPISSWSTVLSWRRILAGVSQLESTSTTETAIGPTTDWKTLKCCLSKITPDCMLRSHGRASPASASPAELLFSAIVLGSRATLERFAVEHAIDGEASRFSPAWEPIYLARKPLVGTVASNVLEHGTGAINVDGCRIETNGEDRSARYNGKAPGGGRDGTSYAIGLKEPWNAPEGRWPANLLLDESAAAMLDERTIDKIHGAGVARKGSSNPAPSVMDPTSWGKVSSTGEMHRFGDSGGASRFFYVAKASRAEREAGLEHHRFIWVGWTWEGVEYQAKLRVDTAQSHPRVIDASGAQCQDASAWNTLLFGSEHTAPFLRGCSSITSIETSSITSYPTLSWLARSLTSGSIVGVSNATGSLTNPVASATGLTLSIGITSAGMVSLPGVGPVASGTLLKISESGPGERMSTHPTMKPLKLMRWLVRLITPPGGIVLDPFMGSGTTGIAAVLEGFNFLGIELEPNFAKISNARIAHAMEAA